MDLIKESVVETQGQQEKESATGLSIEDAFIILGVYAADIDPNNCQEYVRLIVDLAQQQPEFMEISKDRESMEKRIHFYLNEMQTPDHAEANVNQAVRVVTSDLTQRVISWIVRICNTSGLTVSKMKKLNKINAKLRG
jgi:hypothetical protein